MIIKDKNVNNVKENLECKVDYLHSYHSGIFFKDY